MAVSAQGGPVSCGGRDPTSLPSVVFRLGSVRAACVWFQWPPYLLSAALGLFPEMVQEDVNARWKESCGHVGPEHRGFGSNRALYDMPHRMTRESQGSLGVLEQGNMNRL